MNSEQIQSISIYNPQQACVIKKDTDDFGSFSNLSKDFKVRINGILIHSTEALFQACRYPHLVHVQQEILAKKSSKTVIMKNQVFRYLHSREDWEDIKIDVMSWCLKVKLAQNVFALGRLLDKTEDKAIVAHSHNDPFWGTKLEPDGCLKGRNALGKLLMALREDYRQGIDDFREKLAYVEPLNINNFCLLGNPIEPVGRKQIKAA